MKKVHLMVLALIMSFGAFAQDSAMQHSNTMHHQNMKPHDGFAMRNGKVMVMENGKSSTLTQDKTLGNGTVISANGTVKMSDGTTKMLKNGDWVNMDGTMGKSMSSVRWKNKENKMRTDSL